MADENVDPQPKEPTDSDALECSNLPEEHLSKAEDTQ
jgi:hypothetical protein